MDIGKSFTFAFEDNDWLTKLGLGAVVSGVPLLNFAWNGYLVELIRNVARDDPQPLPTWTDLGEKLLRGLVVSVAVFIYFLPAILVGCLGFFSFLLPALAADQDYVDKLAVFSSGLGLALFCCLGLYALIMSFFVPAVFINYARQGTFPACFQIGEILRIISGSPGDYLTAWVMTLAIGMAGGSIISIGLGVLAMIPCIGIFFVWAVNALVGAWMSVVYGHLFGQVARLDLTNA